MRYALILAGGSGTRLWPMSTKDLPKQLIPFIDGKSLLQVAMERLDGLLPLEQVFVCAVEAQKDMMIRRLTGLTAGQFIGEPMGRDTLNAVGLASSVIGRRDPDAVVAVVTADQIITPVDAFQRLIENGFTLAEQRPSVLVTFGITPTYPATGFGYLQLGDKIEAAAGDAFFVDQYQEKPDLATARRYHDAGPNRYLWNSGMFVWRATTLMDCIRKYAPQNHAGLSRAAEAWDTDQHHAVLSEVYPKLRKISVDYAVMEPASQDPDVTVVAIPMALRWLDVGSWPSFAKTRRKDKAGNVTAGCKSVLLDSSNTLVASDDTGHLIATIGCDNLIVIHTSKVTLVCQADQAEQIKNLHAVVGDQCGIELL